MNEFPRMIYRAPGPFEIHGAHFDTLIVAGPGEQEAALADGWHLSTTEAAAALQAVKDAAEAQAQAIANAAPQPDLDAPPTRAELEQKAGELGIKVDGRWSDRKLRDLIAASLEA